MLDILIFGLGGHRRLIPQQRSFGGVCGGIDRFSRASIYWLLTVDKRAESSSRISE